MTGKTRSTGINATSSSATGAIASDAEEHEHKRSDERRHDELEPVNEPAVQEEPRLADRVERMPVLEHGDPQCERLHEIERDEPWHGDEEGGNAEQDAGERAERLQRDHTRRREQRHAPEGCGEVEQRDPHQHAPMRPAGAEPFARRHGAALAGPDDAFDECAFADETHDEDGCDREDDDDGDRRDRRDGEVPELPPPTATPPAPMPPPSPPPPPPFEPPLAMPTKNPNSQSDLHVRA